MIDILSTHRISAKISGRRLDKTLYYFTSQWMSWHPLLYTLFTFLQGIYPCVSQPCSEEGPEEKPTCMYSSCSRLFFHVCHPLCCPTFDLLYLPPLSHFIIWYTASVLSHFPSSVSFFLIFKIHSHQSALFMEPRSGAALSGSKDGSSSPQTIVDL